MLDEIENIINNFSLTATHDIKSTTVSDINDLYHLIQQGQNNITLAAQDREEANESDQVSELDSKFKQLIDLEARLKLQERTILLMKDRIYQGEKISNPEEYYKTLKSELMKELPATDDDKYFTNQKYISFRQHLWSINHLYDAMPSLTSNNNDDDDDIVMGPTKISLKCPLTTTWLEEPMTSSVCKHTFSKASIFALLRSNNAIECPIPGCNRYIQKQNLYSDDIMADRVRRAKAKEEYDNKLRNRGELFDVE
ncbi:zinc-finger of the MIZ type in Nse subunit-domain-containing protein [Cokeromyces recurvatus]|uniref:zinc-finger of the MIZ type in Nse subunit-domain-containing protein n=1 Tax=Cokeromyces recurvatus TaxID=90255 RepID=UPI002220FE20|nr:zinc-finger of the MIZ type in Nse subunit-domain-containing protein [Cokeromyces recurvatus]KAI7898200.1 zinc-finger of the MIZ type in Nse subunit-domain-containing protein [Cokeromyces recurvatus]